MAYIDSREPYIPDEDRRLLKARLLVDFGQAPEAKRMIAGVEQVDARNKPVLDWLRIDCALSDENYHQAIQLLEAYNDENPHE